MRKISAVFKVGVVLGIALGATNAVADDFDACKEVGGHIGQGTTNPGESDVSIKDAIPNSIYHYEIWYQEGDNSITYYPDGTFSAKWSHSSDFLARVGLKYNSDKPHSDLAPISADFKFTKGSSSEGFSFIGIYGWTKEPLSEYYIVDDWFGGRPIPGEKSGEIEVDGDVYDIYLANRWNAPSILDRLTDFPQFFSVRRHGRQCGHIDISAHLKKWEEFGFGGMLYESKLLVEAGNDASGSIDFTVVRMQDANTLAQSSSVPGNRPIAVFRDVAGVYQVFNMIGKYMGKIELAEGSSMVQLLKAKFGAATYIVKGNGLVNTVSVK